jgi:alkylhydroperoxidase family enzyme
MARVPYLTKEDVEPDDRVLLDRPANIFRALVNSPGGARAFARHGSYLLGRSKLDPRLRELAIIQVGYAARSPYEYSHHIEIGRQAGLSDDDIRAIAEETAGRKTHLNDLERAALRAARDLTTEISVPDETFAVLEAGLERPSLVDLILTIAYYNGVVRILSALEVDVEDQYLPLLAEFPLPA